MNVNSTESKPFTLTEEQRAAAIDLMPRAAHMLEALKARKKAQDRIDHLRRVNAEKELALLRALGYTFTPDDPEVRNFRIGSWVFHVWRDDGASPFEPKNYHITILNLHAESDQ